MSIYIEHKFIRTDINRDNVFAEPQIIIPVQVSYLQGIRWLIAEQFVSMVTSSLVAEG